MGAGGAAVNRGESPVAEIWATAAAVLSVDVTARLTVSPLTQLERIEIAKRVAILGPVGPLRGAHDVVQRSDTNADPGEVGFLASRGESLELPPVPAPWLVREIPNGRSCRSTATAVRCYILVTSSPLVR
jgi:hypothetical protein